MNLSYEQLMIIFTKVELYWVIMKFYYKHLMIKFTIVELTWAFMKSFMNSLCSYSLK
jgi:hypothetical protein